ncbi:PAS domain S-box protein [Rhizobiales bacterium L72]|uniref:histidine kinase n=1 Tax=Propylenella binzhouense TaxID=2555902 RepID=A0A964T803_9HYPH|nr:PAS domain S-box protein [Propylenella binzhouense]
MPPPLHPLAGLWESAELSRRPVRFLWQTDSANRFLFVSPGLAQVVGRNSEVVGERWQDAAARLRLDPGGRIGRALGRRDTWSGLTAWWPVETGAARVPVELTGLPVFGIDQSFQGFRGFGVLKPAEALMSAAFEARFPEAEQKVATAEQVPPYEETVAAQPVNVVPIRADLDRLPDFARLSPHERSAFEEIAEALRTRIDAPVYRRADMDAGGRGGLRAAGSEGYAAGMDRGDRFPGAQDDPEPAGDEPEPGGRVLRLFPGETAGQQPAFGLLRDGGVRPADQERDRDREPAAAGPSPESGLSDAAETAGSDAGPDEGRGPAPPGPPHGPEDLERRLQELASVLEASGDGVAILAADGAVVRLDARAEALFGTSSAEAAGRPFFAFFSPASREAAEDYFGRRKAERSGGLLVEACEVEGTVGAATLPLSLTIGPIAGEGGRYCAVLRDVSRWKRAEADLVAARKNAEAASSHKSEFLARVSHEIRTPLNAIIGFAEVMIEQRFGPVENERYREYLRDIRTSGEHVVSLVNDLLDISKIEAGRLELNFEAVAVNDLVRECITLMQPEAGRAHVILRSSLSSDVPAVVADARTLRQIVLNLLSNSVKYTGPGGQVIASTTLRETGEVVLRLRDTGEGMTEEELERALEPFRQNSNAMIGNRGGTGLGLPLTRALVEANRAGFLIRSTPGEGTTVTVTFPPARVLGD